MSVVDPGLPVSVTVHTVPVGMLFELTGPRSGAVRTIVWSLALPGQLIMNVN